MEIGIGSVLLWIIGATSVFLALDKLNNKWFAIDEKVLQSALAIKINRWSGGALVSVLLVFIFFRKQTQDEYAYIPEFAAAVIAIAGVQSYFEWKLLKGSKKYIMTLVTYGLALLVIFFVISFL